MDVFMIFVVFWFVGANALYIWKVRKYMKWRGLPDVENSASRCEKNVISEFYLRCLISWPFYIINSIREKRPL